MSERPNSGTTIASLKAELEQLLAAGVPAETPICVPEIAFNDDTGRHDVIGFSQLQPVACSRYEGAYDKDDSKRMMPASTTNGLFIGLKTQTDVSEFLNGSGCPVNPIRSR